MTAAWGAVLVAALALSGAALGFVIRMSMRWTRLEGRIDANSSRLGEVVSAMREDRAATNARLTWLERRQVWGSPRRRPREPSDTGED